MIIPAICFLGGLVAMGRTKPQTAVRKLVCLGPRSGLVYPVEDFPEVGTLVVRAPNGRAIAQFIRAAMQQPGKPGLVYQNGQGDPQLLELIRRDFAVEPKLEAVPKPGSAAASLTDAEREFYWKELAYRAPELLTEDQKRIVDAMASEPHPKAAAAPAKPTSKASTPSGI